MKTLGIEKQAKMLCYIYKAISQAKDKMTIVAKAMGENEITKHDKYLVDVTYDTLDRIASALTSVDFLSIAFRDDYVCQEKITK